MRYCASGTGDRRGTRKRKTRQVDGSQEDGNQDGTFHAVRLERNMCVVRAFSLSLETARSCVLFLS